MSTALLLLGTLILRIRLIVTAHDVPALAQITPDYIRLHKYRFSASIVRFGLRVIFLGFGLAGRRMIVHQQSLADSLIRDYGVAAQKINVIPLATLPFALPVRAHARERLGLQPDGNYVLYFGFATGYKGIEALLEGMRLIGARTNEPPQLLLGAGYHPKKHDNADYADYYAALTSRSAEISNVHHVGFITDDRLDDYIAACDVAIFPYVQFQGMSGPLHQCVSRGMPVLVSRPIADALDSVTDGSFNTTAEDIADVIMRFFGDSSFHDQVATESQQLQGHLVESDAGAMTRRIYDEVLSEG